MPRDAASGRTIRSSGTLASSRTVASSRSIAGSAGSSGNDLLLETGSPDNLLLEDNDDLLVES